MVALWDASGASTQLAADASAVGVGEGGEILLGSAEALRVMDPSGREKARYRGASGLSALAGIGPWLVLGFDNGNLELVPREGAEGARGAFEGGPARPVVKLLAGPMGTVIAGYASGHLAIWDLSSGALVHQSKLHGALEHLYLSPEGGRLYATSVLGDTAQLDLSVFEADYCEVLREVWSQVPTLWEEGVATRRAAPGDHRCSSAESR